MKKWPVSLGCRDWDISLRELYSGFRQRINRYIFNVWRLFFFRFVCKQTASNGENVKIFRITSISTTSAWRQIRQYFVFYSQMFSIQFCVGFTSEESNNKKRHDQYVQWFVCVCFFFFLFLFVNSVIAILWPAFLMAWPEIIVLRN